MEPTDKIITITNELEALRARTLQLETFVAKVRDNAPKVTQAWLDGWGILFSELGDEAAILLPKPEAVNDSSEHNNTVVDDKFYLTKSTAWKGIMARLNFRNRFGK